MIYPFGSPYVSAYDSTYDPFGTLSLTQGDTPQIFTEPLSLTEVKSYLRLADTFTDDDMVISTLISAAREQAEILQNRDLVRKQWDLHYDYWPEYRIRLRAPVVSVDLIQYKDLAGVTTTMHENTDYTVDMAKQPAIVTPPWNMSWPAYTPWPSSSILIRFTSGYDPSAPYWVETGSKVKIGMMMLISAWYNQRLPYHPGVVSELPFAVTSCLSQGALERAR